MRLMFLYIFCPPRKGMSGVWIPFGEKIEVSEDGLIRYKGTDIMFDTYAYGGKPGNRYVGVTIGKPKYVHRVVCEAFHGKPPTGKHTVEHKDGNRRNNHKDNLCWLTYSENNLRKSVLRAPTSQNKGTKQHYIRREVYENKKKEVVEYFIVRIRKSDLKHTSSHRSLDDAVKARDAVLDEYEAKNPRVRAVSSQTPAE